jgi:hypothetical protein
MVGLAAALFCGGILTDFAIARAFPVCCSILKYGWLLGLATIPPAAWLIPLGAASPNDDAWLLAPTGAASTDDDAWLLAPTGAASTDDAWLLPRAASPDDAA